MKRKLPKPAVILAAALLVVALSVTALAATGTLRQIHLLLGGGSITELENGGSAVQLDTTAKSTIYETRDGRIYLTANGQDLDITGHFDRDTPFIYDFTDRDGIRHAVIIGGDMDAIGSAEFTWNADGDPLGGVSSFGTPEGEADAPWFRAAKTQLGLPW